MKKNLLILTSSFPFAEEMNGIFIKERIKQIKTYFHKIYVICPIGYFPKSFLHLEKFKTYCGHDLYPRNYSYDNVEVFFPKYFPLPASGKISRHIGNFLFFNAVNKLIKRKKIDFDIIQAHFIEFSANTGAILKNNYNKPLILISHGGDIYHFPFHDIRWFKKIKNALDTADKIFTINKRNQEILINEFNIPYEKIKIIYNGIDEELFKPMDKDESRKKCNLPKNKKIILSIGHLIEIKGHKYLIEAVNNIIALSNDILCIFIGSGPLKKKLYDLVEELEIEKNIIFVGTKIHEEIPIWINACDVFVLPSLDEGHPNVIIEALGCGKPIIATSVGGVKETFKDENIGYLIEPCNPEILTESILKALNSEWDVKKIVEFVKKKYTLNRVGIEIIEIYDELIFHQSIQ